MSSVYVSPCNGMDTALVKQVEVEPDQIRVIYKVAPNPC